MSDVFIGAVMSAVLLFFICAFYNKLTVRFFTLKYSGIKKPLRILHITDLHSSRYGTGQRKLISKIEDLKPDIICMTGDIFDERVSSANTAEFIRALRAYTVFFCLGNHELYMDNLEEIDIFLKENNVSVLDGNCVRVCGISICGVSDPKKEEQGEQTSGPLFSERLLSARKECRPGDFKLLLSHRPEKIDEYLPYGFDLILSGHAHGGQWRIPCLINGLWAPHQGLFPKYAGGAYIHGNTTHIVCRGLSNILIIPRIFNPVELYCIDIKAR